MAAYSTLLRPLLFRLDPEAAHHLVIAAGAHLGWAGPAMRIATHVDDDSLATEVAGLHFPTPIGLAAGFDKSGTAIPALAGLGFGAIEIGSVSIDPSFGNPKPRLWRIPADDAIVVHYGLPNDGVEVIAKRLASIRVPVPLGVNLVVTNRGPGAPPLKADQIIGEYVAAAKRMAPHASYLMLNLSCPNTVDGRDFFADFGHLDACLIALGEIGLQLPVFLKVSPLGGIGGSKPCSPPPTGATSSQASCSTCRQSNRRACAPRKSCCAGCLARCPVRRRRGLRSSTSARPFCAWTASATS
jgi:dihydroorotate dehydrogenase